MILRELVHCHAARVAHPDPERPMPPPGWSVESIHLLATLSPCGELMKLEPLGTPDKSGKRIGRPLLVPGAVSTRNNRDHPNRLWDNSDVALGVDISEKDGKTAVNPRRWRAFTEDNLAVFGESPDPDLRAFCKFLRAANPKQSEAVVRRCGIDDWKNITGRNVVFAVNGRNGFLHETEAARRAWNAHPFARANWIPPGLIDKKVFPAQCMVTGEQTECAGTHPKIKRVPDTQQTGASLVSFDKDAFTSHGWTQNENAPAGLETVFQYTTALNWLLRRENGHRVNFPGTVIVFWAEKPSAAEDEIALWMGGEIPEGEDDASLREKLDAMRKGKLPPPVEKNADARFFILGLAGNAGRIAVRFWHESTIGEMWENLRRHHEDLDIIPEYPGQTFPRTIFPLINALSAPGKDGLPGNFAAEFLRAALSGSAYPQSLLARVIARIRAGDPPGRILVAMTKAALIRKNKTHRAEAAVMLNTQSPNPAYNLGRLFAALETAQLAANNWQKPNASVRDKYIAAFAATPARIYPVLMGLANKAHLSADKAGWLNNAVDDIHKNIPDELPAVLQLEEQGKFFLGYHHQRAALRAKKSDENENQPANAGKEKNS